MYLVSPSHGVPGLTELLPHRERGGIGGREKSQFRKCSGNGRVRYSDASSALKDVSLNGESNAYLIGPGTKINNLKNYIIL